MRIFFIKVKATEINKKKYENQLKLKESILNKSVSK